MMSSNIRIVGDEKRQEPASRGAGRPVVYVVDDDPATLALISELAADAGWGWRGFVRLRQVLAALDDALPDLLILDDDLPDGRGGDLARELRTDARLANVPVLVCTAAHPMRQAEIGHWAPVVSKPFHLDAIDRFLVPAARRDTESAIGGQAG